MVAQRAGAYLELTRPGNAVAAGALTFIGSFVAGGLGEPRPIAAAVTATVLAVGAGMAINDYFDRDVDAVNDPERPIPSGRVSPQEALAFSVVLFGLAVVAVALLPLAAVAIAVVNLASLVAYTELFKGLPGIGNAVVGYLTGSTFLFGAAAVGTLGVDVWLLFGLAAAATFAREVVKDVEDVVGDREKGLRTLPIVAGERRALALAVAVMVVAVVASPVPYLWGAFGPTYLVVVVPADAVMLGATAWGFRDPAAGQVWLKRGTYLATVAFAVGRIASLPPV